MKIALAQINPRIADFAANRDAIVQSACQALDQGAELVLTPELSLCGYPPMDLLDQASFVLENQRSLRLLQKELPPEIAVVVGGVDRSGEAKGKFLQNTAFVVYQGRLIHRQAKTLLPTYDVFDEARYFAPATSWEVFEFKGRRMGIAICEDMWWETERDASVRYGLDPVSRLLDAGAELLLVPSASPFYTGKAETRFRLMEFIGKNSHVPVVYVNTVGANDNLIFDGQSMVCDASGRLVHQSPGFREDLSVLDPFEALQVLPVRQDEYGDIAEALRLGIRDYLRKSGFSRVHLGLSGGIDSAVVAVLAAQALGADKVSAFLMPSPYSSEGSITDSEVLGHRLGIQLHTLEIADLMSAFDRALEPLFENCSPDLTEENIQARIRGSLLMAYSNKFGSLVLTTGNKSELAVGYCTLYGDMAGSLAVIGDLFKTQVYGLARYLNRDEEIIPQAIIDKLPSAELRPNQKDQDSLPDYEILDGILKGLILEHKTKTELLADGFPEAVVPKVLRMVAAAEYKRRQAPPVLKVSPRAFGTGRRIPIARKFYEA